MELNNLKYLNLREIGVNRLNLKFWDKDREEAFLEFHGVKSLPRVRRFFLFGLLLFSFFGVYDYLLNEQSALPLLIRFGIVLPGLLLLVVLTYVRRVQVIIEFLLAAGMLLGGIGIIATKALADNTLVSNNYMGVGLVIIFMYTLLPLVFSYALVSGLILAFSWTVFVTLVKPLPFDILLGNMFYVYASTILGILAGRMREQYARRSFFQMLQGLEKQKQIEQINADLERKVNERTEILNMVNHRLHEEILEKIKAEKSLVEEKLRAEESDMAKSAFLANMSHEIRTPMNGILGFAQLLSSPNTNEEKKNKYISIINDNGKLLLKIIDDILDFAKIEAKQLKVEKTLVDVNEVLTRLLATYQVNRQFRRKSHVDIRLLNDPQVTPQSIFTDGKRLEQVLSNLLDNALKFTDEGYIEFGYTQPSNDLITFYVKDTGIGISEKFENLVFERFNQAEIKTFKYGGSGLGLAISKGIIELLGGKIDVETELGKGTTFYFTLPLGNVSAAKPDHPEALFPEARYHWKNKVLLVAEDEEINFSLVKEILSESEVTILHARNGNEVLDILQSGTSRVDLILMDIKMPELNGYETLERIHKANANIPIIAHTAHAMADEKARCLQMGFSDYIPKPIDASQFLHQISRFLSDPF